MPETPWRPSRGVTVVLGLLTLWPLLYGGLFMAIFIFMWASFASGGNDQPAYFFYILPLHCFTMLVLIALTGIYVFHAFKTDRIAPEQRVLWVVILFFGNMLAFPVYWYLFLWRRPPAA